MPLPRGAVLLSPWVDLEATGESIRANAELDYLSQQMLGYASEAYAGGRDRRDPYLSPLHADLRGLPPLLVQTGGAELFLSEDTRFVERAREQGVDVVHEVEDGMVHVYQAFALISPEARAAIDRIGRFLRERGVPGASPVAAAAG
jgi:acetyl esterase/lipase